MTVTAVAHFNVTSTATVVTFGQSTAVGVESGDRYQVSFGFTGIFPPKEFSANLHDRIVVISPSGDRVVAQVTSHFSWIGDGDAVKIDLDIQESMCVAA